jgi:hypothetical protein
MISRRHDKKAPGPFRALAEYIAAAKEKGEKLDDLWIVNSNGGNGLEGLDLAIREVDAQQTLNTRVKKNKSYHLVVSFREDEKPSPVALRDIERHFAEALGFADHPRVVGTHSNTNNFHMHIGYSRIDPHTYKAHWPKHDYRERDKVCRAMEKKHGLKIDLGRKDKIEANRHPTSARDMEAHSWEQSFFNYVQEHKKSLLKALDKTESWQDLHNAFAHFDLVLRKRSNGLVIGNRPTNQHTKTRYIKASSLDRLFSKAALEKRFGPFQEPSRTRQKTKPAQRYSRKPITHYRGQERLWRRYMGMQRKSSSLVFRGFKTWKEFLSYEALGDPLAMAIIHSQKKIMKLITTLPKTKTKTKGGKLALLVEHGNTR